MAWAVMIGTSGMPLAMQLAGMLIPNRESRGVIVFWLPPSILLSSNACDEERRRREVNSRQTLSWLVTQLSPYTSIVKVLCSMCVRIWDRRATIIERSSVRPVVFSSLPLLAFRTSSVKRRQIQRVTVRGLPGIPSRLRQGFQSRRSHQDHRRRQQS